MTVHFVMPDLIRHPEKKRGQATFCLGLGKNQAVPVDSDFRPGLSTLDLGLVLSYSLPTALSVRHRSGDGVCDRINNRPFDWAIASLAWGPQIEPHGGLVHTL